MKPVLRAAPIGATEGWGSEGGMAEPWSYRFSAVGPNHALCIRTHRTSSEEAPAAGRSNPGRSSHMGMRVFVTGASGYLGAAIAARLVKGGCEVQGLVRSEERAENVAALGVKPVLGDLEKPESFLSDLKNNDAVVHAALRSQPETARFDRLALETIRAGGADGRVRHVLYTSGVWVHGDTGETVEDETAPLQHPAEYSAWRTAHEEVALDMVEQEAHVTVMRPGMVYGGWGGEFAGWFR